MDPKQAIEKFNKYLTIRHKIVHGQNYDLKPKKENVKDYRDHVEHLIEQTEQGVKNHVEGLIGQGVDKK